MKIGDRVICIDNDNNKLPLTIGKEYEVSAIGLNCGVQVEVDTGGRYYINPVLFKSPPQSILIDGEETYLATAEELAKDWEGKAIQLNEHWQEIHNAILRSTSVCIRLSEDSSTFPQEYYYSRKHLFPYRLVKPTKTLRSVVEDVTGNVDAIVSAIEENFEITPKQGEKK